MWFKNYKHQDVQVQSDLCGSLKIHTVVGGSGPPLVLLHGYPQTYFIYHKIADKLVEAGYTCIIPDLRGYGKSSKPRAGENHAEYSKREMASDIVQVAQHFGFSTFDLVAHDRGGRVAHRLCLDHPGVVKNLLILDICPTLFMYETTDREFATKYWHWFFQLLPNAEKMIAGDAETFFNTATRDHPFDPEARKDYFEAFSTREGIHGACEDYRAAATIDLEHDRADREAGKKLQVQKLRVLWGDQGLIPKYGDVPGVWEQYSNPEVDVSGKAVDSNHYIPEMAPDGLFEEIKALVPTSKQG